MTDINTIALRRLDLTVLLVFLAMLRHRKAVAVAGEMGLTQSAISHSLARLRAAFDDPLFLRKPHGMEPTAVALALEPTIRGAVEALDRALRPAEPFDPSTASGVLRVAAYDSEIASLVPPLLQRLDAVAPAMQLVVRSLGRGDALAALEASDVDLALGFFWDLPTAFATEPLYGQAYRVVARIGHPVIGQGIDLDGYTTCRHIVVSPPGDLTGIVDDVLARSGRHRTVVAALPLFLPALATVASSDLIATLPERLVDIYADQFGLNAFQPPLELRSFDVAAVVHRRNQTNPLHLWLIEQLRSVATAAC